MSQKRVFHAEGQIKRSTKHWDIFPIAKAGETGSNNYMSGGEAEWKDVQFRLPHCSVPTINSELIDVNYQIQVFFVFISYKIRMKL